MNQVPAEGVGEKEMPSDSLHKGFEKGSAEPGAIRDRRRLEGRNILVTGSARRIGRAIATELALAGARLVLHHWRSDRAVEDLASSLPGAVVVKADLRCQGSARDVVRAAQNVVGCLDGLVNSAAVFERTPLSSLTDDAWDEMLALNLTAPMRLIREAVSGGCTSVVNIVDVGAWQAWPNYAAYATSKAALLHLTRCLAVELAPMVRLNAVAPGAILYPEAWSAKQCASQTDRVPVGRTGDPADVARAVAYLMGESYLTGVCLPVDGGISLVESHEPGANDSDQPDRSAGSR